MLKPLNSRLILLPEYPPHWDDPDPEYEPQRAHLEDSGYEFCKEKLVWWKNTPIRRVKVRKDWPAAGLTAGETCLLWTYITIDDATGARTCRRVRRRIY
tara:strand:+ start:865 stop:1161 length:297 start_codon:yes stop_codon:yes gene_type:complete